MFHFSFQGQEYLVKFYHSSPEDIAHFLADKTTPYKAVTSCVISKILSTAQEMVEGKLVTTHELEIVATGLSRCSKKDNFSRKVGREGNSETPGSLRRALYAMGFEKYPYTFYELEKIAFLAYEAKLLAERNRTK